MKAEAIAEALPDIREAAKRYWLYCRENADEGYAKFNSMIVPRSEKMVGVRAPLIRAVSNPMKRLDRALLRKFIFELWPSKIYEDRVLAAYLAAFVPEWPFLARLAPAADSWVLTDELGCHAFGPLLLEEPARFAELGKWAKSRNVWLRRLAAVSLIHWLRSAKGKKKALAVLDELMLDGEPMVKKAVDWMLREWAKNENAEAFEYMAAWARKGNKHTKSVLTAASWKLTAARKKQLRSML